MSGQENSLFDYSKHAEIPTENLPIGVVKFEDLALCDNSPLCDVVAAEKLCDKQSFSDDAVEPTEMREDELLDSSSFSHVVRRSTDKLPEFEVEKISADLVVESRCEDSHPSSDCHHNTSETRWHSTPSGHHGSVNQSAGPAVKGEPLYRCVVDSTLMICPVESEDAVGQCDEEKVINNCTPVCCKFTTAAAADDDDDGDNLAGGNICVSCNETMAPTECRAVESDCNMQREKTDPHVELRVALAAEEIVSAIGDGLECHQLTMTDDVLSNMMWECVIHENNAKQQGLNCTTSGGQCVIDSSNVRHQVRNIDDIDECAVDEKSLQVLNCTASDADVTDSFDLDVATKDLERAVSAGMLDFLMETDEDSDKDLNSEKMFEVLAELSPGSLSDDDDSDNNGSGDDSADTLAELATDGVSDSVIIIVDDNGSDVEDDDVLEHHKRVRERLKNADNNDSVDHSAVNDQHYTAGICRSVLDDDDDDVLRRHKRVNGGLKCADSSNVADYNVVNDHCDALDIKFLSEDGDVDRFDVTDLNVVCDGTVLKLCEEVKNCLKSNDDDCGHFAADTNIFSTADVDVINCDGDDNDDDVVARHERVKQKLRSAAAVADVDCNFEKQDADVDINCSGSNDSNISLPHGQCLLEADDVIDDGNAANVDAAIEVNCTQFPQDSQLSVVSTPTTCIFFLDDDKQNDKNTSAVDGYSDCIVEDKLNTSEAEDGVSHGILSQCQLPLSDIYTVDTGHDYDYSGETSLLLEELGAGSTSTPSSCSHHSHTQYIIEWHEGIYNGLCRHRDGSEIRMCHVLTCICCDLPHQFCHFCHRFSTFYVSL